MNTTAAATQAGVTTATIRTWARNGVITAAKAGGRWVIDAASLAWRIALTALKTRKAPTMTATATATLTVTSDEQLKVTVAGTGGETLADIVFPLPPTDKWSVMGAVPDEPFEAADRALAEHGWKRIPNRHWRVGFKATAIVEHI